MEDLDLAFRNCLDEMLGKGESVTAQALQEKLTALGYTVPVDKCATFLEDALPDDEVSDLAALFQLGEDLPPLWLSEDTVSFIYALAGFGIRTDPANIPGVDMATVVTELTALVELIDVAAGYPEGKCEYLLGDMVKINENVVPLGGFTGKVISVTPYPTGYKIYPGACMLLLRNGNRMIQIDSPMVHKVE